MTPAGIPSDFVPADPFTCELAKQFDGKTAARFVAVYAVDNLIAVNDGSRIEASWVKPDDKAGTTLRRLLLAATAAAQDPALVLDFERSRCWVAPREQAVRFVGNAAPEV